MSDLTDELLEGIEGFVAHLEDAGLDGEDEKTGEYIVRLRDVKDRLDRLIKAGSEALGQAGVTRFEVEGVSYKLRQAVTYKWDMPLVLDAIRVAAQEQGISELDAVTTACTISTAKVRGLKSLGIDPKEFRDENLGAWRLEGPRAQVEAE